ncbi:MAG: T9SS type A sorting domain-containing protein [Flavobacteriales bacterium]
MRNSGCDADVLFPGYTTPPVFFQWPAHGDPAEGQAADLAPYFDNPNGTNGADGRYDPNDGDVPCLPGDAALFAIFNDKLEAHTGSGGLPIGMEVHMTPFVYRSALEAIDQTVFVRYRLINRSSGALKDCYFGLFNDFDLGCSDDDFIGTDAGRSMVYVYNWSDDDRTCSPRAPGYGEQPPAFGMIVLKGPLLDANDTDDPAGNAMPAWNGTGFGDGIIDNERYGLTSSMRITRDGPQAIGFPFTPEHHSNYLHGIWGDGTPQTYGGWGYSTDPDTTISAFVCPGASDPVGAGTQGHPMPPWSESERVRPDRTILGSMGPIDLGPSDEQEILIAYTYARAPSGGALASVDALQQRADSVRAFAMTIPGVMAPGEPCDASISIGIREITRSMGTLLLFPNPATDRITVQVPVLNGMGMLRILDATGRMVLQRTITAERTEMDVHGLGAGTYAVRMEANGITHLQRLVVL